MNDFPHENVMLKYSKRCKSDPNNRDLTRLRIDTNMTQSYSPSTRFIRKPPETPPPPPSPPARARGSPEDYDQLHSCHIAWPHEV